MTFTLPRLIGHRGVRESAPENTLASLRRAAAEGARMVEVDVMLTRDGVPILMHDVTLDRTSSGHGPVDEADWADIKGLDAGAWFAPAFAGERVPSLEAAIAAMAELGLACNFEIKPTPGREVETSARALEVLGANWPSGLPAPLLSSFSLAAMAHLRDHAPPEWPRGALLADEQDSWARYRQGWRAVLDELEASTVHVWQKGVTGTVDAIADFVAGGRPVAVFTVNDATRARQLLDAGVAALFTDAPARLKAELAGERLTHVL